MPSKIVICGPIWRVAEICRPSLSHYKFSLWNSCEIWEHWWEKPLLKKSCTFKPGLIISRIVCPCQSLSSLLLFLSFVKTKDVNLLLKIIIFHWWGLGLWNSQFLARRDLDQCVFSTFTFQLTYPATPFLVVYVFDELDIQLLNGCWRATIFNEATCSHGGLLQFTLCKRLLSY